MIGINHTTVQVSNDKLDDLKHKIDKIGRTEFCQKIGDNYFSISQKLCGSSRMTTAQHYYYNAMADKLLDKIIKGDDNEKL